MSPVRSLRFVLFGLMGLTAVAGSQGGKLVPGMEDLFLQTKIGSFKILGAGKDIPTGKLEMSFTGTLLLTGTSKEPVVTGNLKKEYPTGKFANDANSLKFKKVLYHGTGKISVEGSFVSAQWFGRDMSGEFKGHGLVRLYGEFDKDLNTGKYWYASDPKNQQDWATGGKQLEVPQSVLMRPMIPRVRSSNGG